MEILVELLLDILFESGIEISSNKRISKWIRYPIIAIIVVFFLVIILGLIVFGILIIDENNYGGLFIIIVGIVFLVLGIKKFKDIYIERKGINNKV